jgi:hypothetical protein
MISNFEYNGGEIFLLPCPRSPLGQLLNLSNISKTAAEICRTPRRKEIRKKSFFAQSRQRQYNILRPGQFLAILFISPSQPLGDGPGRFCHDNGVGPHPTADRGIPDPRPRCCIFFCDSLFPFAEPALHHPDAPPPAGDPAQAQIIHELCTLENIGWQLHI